MTQSEKEIKKKVYKKLIELFPECPYYNTPDYKIDIRGDKLNLPSVNKKPDIWTILDRILPAEIIKLNDRNYPENWKPWVASGEKYVNYFRHYIYDTAGTRAIFRMFELGIDKMETHTIWQSLLSLLEAIEKLLKKEGKKVEFRWGE